MLWMRNIAPQKRGVRNFHLVERQFVVERADRHLESNHGTSVSQKQKKMDTYGRSHAHVSAIDDFETLPIGIESPGQRPGQAIANAAATNSDSRGPEARARSVRHCGIEGHPEQRNIKGGRGIFKTADVGEVGKGEGASEWEVVLRAIFLAPCFGGMGLPGRVTKRGLLVRIGAQGLCCNEDEVYEEKLHL